MHAIRDQLRGNLRRRQYRANHAWVAVRMLTLNPATVLGIEFKKGALRTGADADIVLLTEGLEIARVFVRGTTVQ